MGATVERAREEGATRPRTRKRKKKRASEQDGDVVGTNLGGTGGSRLGPLFFLPSLLEGSFPKRGQRNLVIGVLVVLVLIINNNVTHLARFS